MECLQFLFKEMHGGRCLNTFVQPPVMILLPLPHHLPAVASAAPPLQPASARTRISATTNKLLQQTHTPEDLGRAAIVWGFHIGSIVQRTSFVQSTLIAV